MKRGLQGRLSLGLVDSTLSSASNFLLSGLALAVLEPNEFAAVSLVQAGHIVLLAVMRSTAFEPLLIRGKAIARSGLERGPIALTLTAGGALAVALLLIIVGLVLGTSTVVAFGLALPALLVADALRFASFAEPAPTLAIRVDSIWLGVQAIVALGILTIDDPLPWHLIAAWAAGAVAAVALSARSAVWARPVREHIDRWRGADRDIRFGLLVDALSARAAPAAALFGVAFVLTSDEVALVSGPRAFFGPVNIVITAAMSVGLASAASRAVGLDRSRFVIRLGTFMSAVVVVATGVLAGVGNLLAEVFSGLDDQQIVLRLTLIGAAMLGTVWSTALGVGLRAGERTTSAAKLQVSAAGFLIAGAVAGALVGGAVGALVGQVMARWLAAAMWSGVYRRLAVEGESDVAAA